MVVIRLARFGTKHKPKYRITVADKRRWLNGKFIEVVGHYNPFPHAGEKALVCDLPKIEGWIAKGAQPSERVKSLIKKAQTSA
jgi:small subunit ribosomal protein S16